MKSLIIDKEVLNQKVIRIAYQIVEDFVNEKDIYIVGISGGGWKFAKLLKKEINKIEPIKVHLHQLSIQKEKPSKEITLSSIDKNNLKNKSVILVDDVANSGKTLFYSFYPFLSVQLKHIKIAVLVDREHKKFPVHCNYVGQSLATTIREHIDIVFKDDMLEAAFLH